MAAVTSAAAVPMPVAGRAVAGRPRAPGSTSADGEVGVTVVVEGGLPRRIGFATADAAAEADWTPEVSEALGRLARLRRAEGLQRRQAAGQGAAPGGPARSAASRSTRSSPDGCCVRASPTRRSPTSSTATSTRSCPRPTPPSSCPRPRARRPVSCRGSRSGSTDGAARRAARRASRTVLTDIELPTLLALADMELAGVAVSHDKLVGVLRRPRRARGRHRPGGLRGHRPRGEPRLAEAAAGGALRRAAAAEDPQDQDRATRRMPRCSPTCRRPTRIRSSTCCCSTARRPSCGRSSSRSTSRSPRTAASARRTCRPAARPAACRAPTRTCRTSRSARRRAAASARRSRSARATRRC